MRQQTERVQVLVAPALIERVKDWRFANRIGSQAAAIRLLVERGLEASANAQQPGT